jgi:putative transposase
MGSFFLRDEAMHLHPHEYYHLYNRSNNNERVFKQEANYGYFLQRYKHQLGDLVDTAAYCLMPTHFHFLIRVSTIDTDLVRAKIGVLLSAYTKAINSRFRRHGSLFQEHTKASHVATPEHMLSVTAYIHQNPVKAGLVRSPIDWKYSSYRAYIQNTEAEFLRKQEVLSAFSSLDAFARFSEVATVGLRLPE